MPLFQTRALTTHEQILKVQSPPRGKVCVKLTCIALVLLAWRLKAEIAWLVYSNSIAVSGSRLHKKDPNLRHCDPNFKQQ